MRYKVLMTASVWRHIRNFHLPYLRRFQELGWETHVACNGIPPEAPFVNAVIDLPFEKRMTSLKNLKATNVLKRRIQSERYDLIIAHTTLAAFFTRLALKWACPRRTTLPRPKLINVMHGYLFDDATPWFKRSVLLAAECLTAPLTDLLLVMNEWDYQTARKYKLGRRIEKISGMGVDFSRLDKATEEDGKRLRTRFGIADDSFVLLYAAEFSPRKCQRVLIRAMTLLPEEVVLVLPGDGMLLSHCEQQARELGAGKRIVFPGQVTDMGAWYRAANACVSSSRSEGLPFNIMEAMHMGLPVVASAVKGHVDLVEDGVNGLLYPYGEETAFADRVCRLMGDNALTERIGRQGRLDVEQYAMDNVFDGIMGRYLSVAH